LPVFHCTRLSQLHKIGFWRLAGTSNLGTPDLGMTGCLTLAILAFRVSRIATEAMGGTETRRKGNRS